MCRCLGGLCKLRDNSSLPASPAARRECKLRPRTCNQGPRVEKEPRLRSSRRLPGQLTSELEEEALLASFLVSLEALGVILRAPCPQGPPRGNGGGWMGSLEVSVLFWLVRGGWGAGWQHPSGKGGDTARLGLG